MIVFDLVGVIVDDCFYKSVIYRIVLCAVGRFGDNVSYVVGEHNSVSFFVGLYQHVCFIIVCDDEIVVSDGCGKMSFDWCDPGILDKVIRIVGDSIEYALMKRCVVYDSRRL